MEIELYTSVISYCCMLKIRLQGFCVTTSNTSIATHSRFVYCFTSLKLRCSWVEEYVICYCWRDIKISFIHNNYMLSLVPSRKKTGGKIRLGMFTCSQSAEVGVLRAW